MQTPNTISNILGPDGKPFVIEASHYDVVNRWDDNDSWTFATNNSGDRTDLPHDRNKIAAACSFEYANNPYCKAMVNKLGYEVISTGPIPEITPRSPSKRAEKAANRIEKLWVEWADESSFSERLFLNVTEPVIRGELFNVFRSNFALETVQVEFEQYEGIQFSTPYASGMYSRGNNQPQLDGIRLDQNGNISEYHKLDSHPGSTGGMGGYGYSVVDPRVCSHIFRKERPTQYRGISQLGPVVEQFAYLRRFTDAYVSKAEKEASILAVIETRLPIEDCAPGPKSSKVLNFGAAQLMNMPEGWAMNEFKGHVNGTQYTEFVNAKLREIMSVLFLPWNIASGDSSEYNFSSSRMDHLIFDRVIAIIRSDLERKLINRFFKFWFEFASLTPGLVSRDLGKFDVRWFWPKRTAIDEVRQANALKVKQEIGLLDEPAYWQDEGQNWKEAKEKKIRMELWEEKRRAELRDEIFGKEEPKPIDREVDREDEPVDMDDSSEYGPSNGRPVKTRELSDAARMASAHASRLSFSIN